MLPAKVAEIRADHQATGRNGGPAMTALPEIDYRRVFKISPTAMALLTPDLVILDANDEFLADLGRQLSDLVGHNVFTVLPKMPPGPAGPKVTALERALASREREVLELTRYDFEDPGRPGVFEERYWSSVATPLCGPDGEIEMLELSAREVTAVIAHFRSMQAQYG
jgi:PAS domain-containing protein